MNCHSITNVLDLHKEGRLSLRRTRAVEAHLASCSACRALAESSSVSSLSPSAPSALKSRLLAALKSPSAAAERKSAPHLPLWPREARGILLAAALLMIVGFTIAAVGVNSQSTGEKISAVEEP
ncbi:MAG: zf-HC2 domain-containing protein [Elusimicrobiota bacterium]